MAIPLRISQRLIPGVPCSVRSPARSRKDALQPLRAASGTFAAPQGPSRSQGAEVSGTDSGEGKVEFGGALVNVLNILSGVGLLSVPYALKKAGWVGLGVLWLLGIVTNYTGGPCFVHHISPHAFGWAGGADAR